MKKRAESSVDSITDYALSEAIPPEWTGILNKVWPSWREDYQKNPQLGNMIFGVAQQRGLFNLLGKFNLGGSGQGRSQVLQHKSSGF